MFPNHTQPHWRLPVCSCSLPLFAKTCWADIPYIPCQAQVTAKGWPVAAVQKKGILMGVTINRESQRFEKVKRVFFVQSCDCCSILCWKRLTGVVLITNALGVMTPFRLPSFWCKPNLQPDVEQAEKAVALPGPSLTKPLQVLQSTTTAKGCASANTSPETATYPYIPETKILLLRLASNAV